MKNLYLDYTKGIISDLSNDKFYKHELKLNE